VWPFHGFFLPPGAVSAEFQHLSYPFYRPSISWQVSFNKSFTCCPSVYMSVSLSHSINKTWNMLVGQQCCWAPTSQRLRLNLTRTDRLRQPLFQSQLDFHCHWIVVKSICNLRLLWRRRHVATSWRYKYILLSFHVVAPCQLADPILCGYTRTLMTRALMVNLYPLTVISLLACFPIISSYPLFSDPILLLKSRNMIMMSLLAVLLGYSEADVH
jgi:hypothetical protein